MEKMIVVSESVLIVDQAICGKNTLFQLSIRKYIIDKIQMLLSAHRRILEIVSVVCVPVKICVSSISLYKLDPGKLTTPFVCHLPPPLSLSVSASYFLAIIQNSA